MECRGGGSTTVHDMDEDTCHCSNLVTAVADSDSDSDDVRLSVRWSSSTVIDQSEGTTGLEAEDWSYDEWRLQIGVREWWE